MSSKEIWSVSSGLKTDHPDLKSGTYFPYEYGNYFYLVEPLESGGYRFVKKISLTPGNQARINRIRKSTVIMNEYELSEKERFFISHLKSIAAPDDTDDELFAVTLLAENFDDDGNEDEYLDKAINYIKEHEKATVKEIGHYLESIQTPIEVVDNEEESA